MPAAAELARDRGSARIPRPPRHGALIRLLRLRSHRAWPLFAQGVLVLAVVATARPIAATENRSMFRLTHTILVPEATGRLGHFAFDHKSHRLFLTEPDDGAVEIFDLTRYAPVRRLTGFHAPQEVVVVERFKSLLITDAGSGTCDILESNTYDPIRRITLGKDASALRFDPRGKVAYVGFGEGAIGVIDVTVNEIIGTILLDAAPAAFEREHTQGMRMFVNLPTLARVAVADQERRIVTAQWPIELARGNRSMALDERGHRLFVGTTQPPQIRVIDTVSGASIASVDCTSDIGDLQYDAARGRLYAAAGGGFVDVIEAVDKTDYQRTARIPTAAGARTALFIPELNQVFVGVPKHGAQPAEIRVYDIQY